MHLDAAMRLRFESSLRTIVSSDEGLFLLSEGGHA
jgi:hypothetical protein